MSSKFFLQPLELSVEVVAARNVNVSNYITSCLYAVVYLDGHVLGTTPNVYRTSNPVWKTKFKTSITHTKGAHLCIKLFNGECVVGYATASVDKYYCSPTPTNCDSTWFSLLDGSGYIDFELTVNAFPDVSVLQPSEYTAEQWWEGLQTDEYSSLSCVPETKSIMNVLECYDYSHRRLPFSMRGDILKDIAQVMHVASAENTSRKLKHIEYNNQSLCDTEPSNFDRFIWIVSGLQRGAPLVTKLSFSLYSDYLRMTMGLMYDGIPVLCCGNPSYELFASTLAVNVDPGGALHHSLVYSKDPLSIQLVESESIVDTMTGGGKDITLEDIDYIEINRAQASHYQTIESHACNGRRALFSANVFWFRPSQLAAFSKFQESRREIHLAREEYRLAVFLSDSSCSRRYFSHGYSLLAGGEEEEHYFHAPWESPLVIYADSGDIHGGCKIIVTCEVLVNGVILSMHNIAEQFVRFQDIISKDGLLVQNQDKVYSSLSTDIALRNEQRLITISSDNLLSSINNGAGVGLLESNYICSCKYQLLAVDYRSEITDVFKNSAKSRDDPEFLLRIIEPNEIPVATHVRLLFAVQKVVDIDNGELIEIGHTDIKIEGMPSAEDREYNIQLNWELVVPLFHAEVLSRLIAFKYKALVCIGMTNPTAFPLNMLGATRSPSDPLSPSSAHEHEDLQGGNNAPTSVLDDPFASSVSQFSFGDNEFASTETNKKDESQCVRKLHNGASFGTLRLVYQVYRRALNLTDLDTVLCAPSCRASNGCVSTVCLQELRQYEPCIKNEPIARRPIIIQSMKPPQSELFERKCTTDISGNGILISFTNSRASHNEKNNTSACERKFSMGRLSDFVKSGFFNGRDEIYFEVYEVIRLSMSDADSYYQESSSLDCWLLDSTCQVQYPQRFIHNDQDLEELSSVYSVCSEWMLQPNFRGDVGALEQQQNKIFFFANGESMTISSNTVNTVANNTHSYVLNKVDTEFEWEYGTSLSALSDPLLRCSTKLPGCIFKRRRWVRHLDKFALPMALFSDLHESIRDVMPSTHQYTGPYQYSEWHKAHEQADAHKFVATPEAIERVDTTLAPPFFSPSQKRRFGSTKERCGSFQYTKSVRSMSFRALDLSCFENDIETKDALLPAETVVSAEPLHNETIINAYFAQQTQFIESECTVDGTSEQDSSASIMLSMACIVEYRVITADVIFVACHLRHDVFSVLERMWNITAYEKISVSNNEDSDADENDQCCTFLIELYISCESSLEVFRFISMMLHVSKARAEFSNIMPSLTRFKNRVSDRDRMSLMKTTHAEMEMDRKAIWLFLSSIRATIRSLYIYSLMKLPSVQSDVVFDISRYTSDFSKHAAVALNNFCPFMTELSTDIQFKLDFVPELVMSLLNMYHSLVVSQSLDEPPSYRVLEICLAEEMQPQHLSFDDKKGSADYDGISSRCMSDRTTYSLGEELEDFATTSILQSGLPISRVNSLKCSSALEDAHEKTSMTSKRSAVRYSYTPTSPLETATVIDNTQGTDNDVAENFEKIVSPDLFTKYHRSIPIGVTHTAKDVMAFASFFLDETEARMLLCSALKRSGAEAVDTTSTDHPVDMGVSELCVILNMLITRCIRQIVMVTAGHISRAAAEPHFCNYLHPGLSSVLVFHCKELNLLEISKHGYGRHSSPRSGLHITTIERDFNVRYKPSYNGCIISVSNFLPLTSYLIRSNGRLLLTAHSVSVNSGMSINRSALLAFFMDFKSILKWELRPRIERVYEWCIKFCSISLFKYLEIKNFAYDNASAEGDAINDAREILGAPEDFALLLHESLFKGAFDLFLMEYRNQRSIFNPGQACDECKEGTRSCRFGDVRSELLKNSNSALRFSRKSIISRYRRNIFSESTISSRLEDNKSETDRTSDREAERVILDTHSLRNISFLNDIRQVCCRSFEILLNHYSVSLSSFSWDALESYLHSNQSGTQGNFGGRCLADLKRDISLFCGLGNDCVDFSILIEECAQAICHVVDPSDAGQNLSTSLRLPVFLAKSHSRFRALKTATDTFVSTADHQQRGRIASMRRAGQDYGAKLYCSADSFARLAVSTVNVICKELLKSAEASATVDSTSLCRFSAVADILSFAEIFIAEISGAFMTGLYALFLKMLLEQITELILKHLALDIDGNEYFYLEHVADIGSKTAFSSSKKKLLSEIRAIRMFFFEACTKRDWHGDFTSVPLQSHRDRNSNKKKHFVELEVTDIDGGKDLSKNRLGPMTFPTKDLNRKKQRAFSRSDVGGLSAQLQHLRETHQVTNRSPLMVSQESFESNIIAIDEQWGAIKEVHPELGSLLYTLEKRLEIDNRYDPATDDDDVPSVLDIGTVIRTVSYINPNDHALDAFSVLTLPSYRSALDRRFYGVVLGTAPEITLKVPELSVLHYKYKAYTLSASGSVNLNAELWCLCNGETVRRVVTKTRSNDRYASWKDALQHTYKSNRGSDIVDELVVIICNRIEETDRRTVRDVPLCYARLTVSAIDVCTDITESVDLHPLSLNDSEWIHCTTSLVLPNDFKAVSRSRLNPQTSEHSELGAGSSNTNKIDEDIGELRIRMTGLISCSAGNPR